MEAGVAGAERGRDAGRRRGGGGVREHQFEDLGESERNALDVGGMASGEVADTLERLLAAGSHLV
ncbi:MAG TPA: hypothetical protein VFP21_04400 [Solirubrobacterales bacterium]|nr:hypothetical protein [Solirubrobacterales bacterium]